MKSRKIIAFCSFDLLVAVSVSITVVVVWAPHYHYNVVRTKARKLARKNQKMRRRDEKSGWELTPKPQAAYSARP